MRALRQQVRGGCGPVRGGRLGDGDLELGTEGGDRALQLMGSVGDEFALACALPPLRTPPGRGAPEPRRSSARPEMSATSARIASTGRNARPTSTQLAT